MLPRDQLATTPAQNEELGRLLSGGRMNSYDDAVAAAQDQSFEALDVYVYNMSLSSAYLGPLHLLEITARNAMHHRLKVYANREDWWDSDRIQLVNRQCKDLERKTGELRDERLRDSLPAPTPDDIVATMDFGFWTGLLKNGDKEENIDYERALWQPAIKNAFPKFKGNRGDLWLRMDRARRLRNRVGHHEPIHNRDHDKTYRELISLLAFVSPEVAQWCEDRSRLLAIANSAPGTLVPVVHF